MSVFLPVTSCFQFDILAKHIEGYSLRSKKVQTISNINNHESRQKASKFDRPLATNNVVDLRLYLSTVVLCSLKVTLSVAL